jgi:Holliday junction resolvase RusA-like endonuclease
MTSIHFTVYGEPASKSNSRKIVTIKGRPAVIKSKKAREYVKAFAEQCPQFADDLLFEDDVEVRAKIFYASRRPDLDESVILDCMQGYVYKNDRQVKRKIIEWGLDRENPRAEIVVRLLKPSVEES